MPTFPEKPEACKGCPAYKDGCGFVPFEGSPNAPLTLIGHGPGEQDAHFSRPFYPNSPSGSTLDRWINRAGKSRTEMFIGNIVLCWMPKGYNKQGPYGNRIPTEEEINYCWKTHVGKIVNNTTSRFIAPIGVPATRWFLGIKDGGVEKYIGTFSKLEIKDENNGKQQIRSTDERVDDGSDSAIGVCSGGEPEQSKTVRPNEPNDERHSGSIESTESYDDRSKQRLGVSRKYPEKSTAEPRTIELSEMYKENQLIGKEVSLLQRSTSSENGRWIIPLMHPSAIVRGRWELGPVQEIFIKRIIEHSFNNTEPKLQDPTQPPPNTNLYPTISDTEKFVEEVKAAGAFALDIEEAGMHIICVGMTALDLQTEQIGTTICLRFRNQGGGLYWKNWNEHYRAVELLQELLKSPVSKVFQNGITFDVPELIDLGFEVNGPYIDTMHLAHTAYCELPKSLQFLSTLYLESPVWKSLVDDEELEGKG